MQFVLPVHEDELQVALISGPNLAMLGHRDPAVYGTATLGDLAAIATPDATDLGATLTHAQHDAEADLVAAVHAAVTGPDPADAIVINAGALTHFGLSLRDALEIARIPKVELHLSKPQAREEFREALSGCGPAR